MANGVCLISILVLIMLLGFNLTMSFSEETYISLVMLLALVYVYYLSRFKKRYKAGITIYAIMSYIALALTFFYNSGISGPTIILFFLSFQMLVTVTPRRQHVIWATAHVVLVTALCIAEYKYPDEITLSYRTRTERFSDIIFTFILSLTFVYLITIHLRNNLDRIRKKATERADAIEAHLHEIELQNKKLKEIAWLQSHRVRSQVATILGLSQFVNYNSITDPDLTKVLAGIKEAAHNLDEVIKEINQITNGTSKNDEGQK